MYTTLIALCRLPHAEGLDLPAYATLDSAGMDLRAAIDADAPIEIAPGARVMIPTGLQLALPRGFEGQVRPRSGLAWEHGLTVLNAPGTIDADYRGEVKVLLVHLGEEPLTLSRGDRIAQLVIAKHVRVEWEERESLETTRRGEGGFGHTGR